MIKLSRENYWPVLVISAAVLLVFGWSVSFGFLYYDDHIHVFENQPLIKGEILYFWKHAHEGLYIPLVYSAWALLYKFFGLNPAVFHGLNVVLHIANSWLVFLLLRSFRMTLSSSVLAALLFAVHPVQVESVAWVSALKDTSFAFFTLLSLWVYFSSSFTGHRKWLAGTLLVSAAILCKPTAVVLPVLISIYFIYFAAGNIRDRLKNTWNSVGPMPLTLFLGLYAIQMAKTEQSWSQHPNAMVSLLERPLIMLDALGFYITKILLPSQHYVDYARFPRNVLDNKLYYFYVALAVVFLIVLAGWFRKNENRRSPEAVFAVLLGFMFFIPTSGIVTFGHQKISTTADRYMYMIMVAVAIFAAMLLEWIQASGFRRSANKIAAIILFGLGAFSFMQLINWKDISLFTENLYEGNPNNYFANRNFGLINQLKGNDEKALEYFKRADAIDPSHLSAKAAIASLYFNRRDYENLDRFVEQNLTEEKLASLQQTPYETHAFFMAIAESYIERKNYGKAMAYLCKAKRLNVGQFAGEVAAKIDSVKKLDAEAGSQCVN
jgi:tetratricopeptide (TPR) repeat protein